MLSAIAFACRLVLGAVFAIAGLAKLRDQEGTRTAVQEFGVRERFAGGTALVLPLAELVVVVLLLPAGTATWGALGALLLLAVFSTAIALALARGHAPRCHCFGRLRSEPAGWRTLARNAVLAALGAFVVVAGRDDGPGAFAWTARLDGLEWVTLALAVGLAAAVIFGGLVVLHLTRSYGRVLTRLDRAEERLLAAGLGVDDPEELPPVGLAPGTPAPPFSVTALNGERVTLDDLRRPGLPVLLLFTSPTCGQCSVLMPKVAEWQRDHAGALTVALLSSGKPKLVREKTEGLESVLLDKDLSVYEAYDVSGTPSAVLVGDDGTIAMWAAAGGEWIETLVDQALGGLGRTPGLPIGAEAPSQIADLVDGPTAVLFWNPECGFCQSMEDDLRSWLDDTPAGAPALLVVSSGDCGLDAPVVPDPDWTLAGSLGADGTPMAALVDGEGRIASSLVTGAPDVLALLGARELAPAD